MSGSRIASIIGLIIAVFGAISAHADLFGPKWGATLAGVGALLAAFNERVTGGLSTKAVALLLGVGLLLSGILLLPARASQRDKKARSAYVTLVIPRREAQEMMRQCDSGRCEEELARALQAALGDPSKGSEEEDRDAMAEIKRGTTSYGDPRQPLRSAERP